MAKFDMELPTDLIKQFEKIHDNADQIFGQMTRAGAEVAMSNIKSNVPNRELGDYLAISRTYKTPSDGGINTKVYFRGYMPFSGNRTTFSRRGRGSAVYTTHKGVPAGFVAMIYEYGRSNNPFPRKPFLRKSFRNDNIEKAMLRAQKEASGGLLDDE